MYFGCPYLTTLLFPSQVPAGSLRGGGGIIPGGPGGCGVPARAPLSAAAIRGGGQLRHHPCGHGLPGPGARGSSAPWVPSGLRAHR